MREEGDGAESVRLWKNGQRKEMEKREREVAEIGKNVCSPETTIQQQQYFSHDSCSFRLFERQAIGRRHTDKRGGSKLNTQDSRPGICDVVDEDERPVKQSVPLAFMCHSQS